nr:DUF29 domain-containing protein [Methylobrevis pamukkalensis]
MKWQYQPQLRSVSWEVTILRERHHIDRLLQDNPSLKDNLKSKIEGAYLRARKEAAIETRLARKTFPAEPPWTTDQILDDEFLPDAV